MGFLIQIKRLCNGLDSPEVGQKKKKVIPMKQNDLVLKISTKSHSN